MASSTSNIDIANFALTELGAGRILSLNDLSEPAIVLNLLFEHIRQYCLGHFNWTFARKRAVLAELSNIPAYEFTHQYELPSDFIRLIQAGEVNAPYHYSTIINYNTQAWVIEDNKILTNYEAPLKILYTADITDSSRFPPLFIKFFALNLALHACEQLTQSTTKKQMIEVQIKSVLKMASASDRMQNPPMQPETGSWNDARILGMA
ncbi:hypothetical protein EBU95_18860 [bacterium]|nr:hypothetical protein [bacterium]